MPNYRDHSDQANHNLDFLRNFYKDFKFNDWAITVSFYAAVHIVEFVICKKEDILYLGNKLKVLHSEDLFNEVEKNKFPLPKNVSTSNYHQARGLIVAENFGDIYGYYDLLYNSSRTARYKKHFWPNHVTQLVVEAPLEAIVKWVNKNFLSTFDHKIK